MLTELPVIIILTRKGCLHVLKRLTVKFTNRRIKGIQHTKAVNLSIHLLCKFYKKKPRLSNSVQLSYRLKNSTFRRKGKESQPFLCCLTSLFEMIFNRCRELKCLFSARVTRWYFILVCYFLPICRILAEILLLLLKTILPLSPGNLFCWWHSFLVESVVGKTYL